MEEVIQDCNSIEPKRCKKDWICKGSRVGSGGCRRHDVCLLVGQKEMVVFIIFIFIFYMIRYLYRR
jgi:hypothetical protein